MNIVKIVLLLFWLLTLLCLAAQPTYNRTDLIIGVSATLFYAYMYYYLGTWEKDK